MFKMTRMAPILIQAKKTDAYSTRFPARIATRSPAEIPLSRRYRAR